MYPYLELPVQPLVNILVYLLQVREAHAIRIKELRKNMVWKLKEQSEIF